MSKSTKDKEAKEKVHYNVWQKLNSILHRKPIFLDPLSRVGFRLRHSHKSGKDIHPNRCKYLNIETQEIWKKCNVTPLKVVNTLVTDTKYTRVDKKLYNEFK
jgi:hypothetical protein